MSQQVDTLFRTFTAGAAIGRFIRVKLTSGKLAVAVAADRDYLGTIEEAAFADLDVRRVRLRTAQGTAKMVADAAVTLGATVFTRAAGKVGATAVGSFIIGVALEAAAADGDVIEVLSIDGSVAQ